MNKLYKYFSNIDEISHAFLIGNVVFDEIEKDINEIINKKIIKNNIDILNNPDVYIYDQEENLITKEEIKNLLNHISTTSQFNNAKIYIINGAEKLTDSVYNAILKTLEEPENNIYAFLISKNIDAVKPTIRSRCQIIYLNSIEDECIDENINKLAEKFINNIENNNIKTIALKSEIYNEIESRETFKKILQVILKKYDIELNSIIKEEKKVDNESKNSDIIILSRKILIIDKFINMLNNYLNKNLIIDRFIIEMWRCNT